MHHIFDCADSSHAWLVGPYGRSKSSAVSSQKPMFSQTSYAFETSQQRRHASQMATAAAAYPRQPSFLSQSQRFPTQQYQPQSQQTAATQQQQQQYFPSAPFATTTQVLAATTTTTVVSDTVCLTCLARAAPALRDAEIAAVVRRLQSVLRAVTAYLQRAANARREGYEEGEGEEAYPLDVGTASHLSVFSSSLSTSREALVSAMVALCERLCSADGSRAWSGGATAASIGGKSLSSNGGGGAGRQRLHMRSFPQLLGAAYDVLDATDALSTPASQECGGGARPRAYPPPPPHLRRHPHTTWPPQEEYIRREVRNAGRGAVMNTAAVAASPPLLLGGTPTASLMSAPDDSPTPPPPPPRGYRTTHTVDWTDYHQAAPPSSSSCAPVCASRDATRLLLLRLRAMLSTREPAAANAALLCFTYIAEGCPRFTAHCADTTVAAHVDGDEGSAAATVDYAIGLQFLRADPVPLLLLPLVLALGCGGGNSCEWGEEGAGEEGKGREDDTASTQPQQAARGTRRSYGGALYQDNASTVELYLFFVHQVFQACRASPPALDALAAHLSSSSADTANNNNDIRRRHHQPSYVGAPRTFLHGLCAALETHTGDDAVRHNCLSLLLFLFDQQSIPRVVFRGVWAAPAPSGDHRRSLLAPHSDKTECGNDACDGTLQQHLQHHQQQWQPPDEETAAQLQFLESLLRLVTPLLLHPRPEVVRAVCGVLAAVMAAFSDSPRFLERLDSCGGDAADDAYASRDGGEGLAEWLSDYAMEAFRTAPADDCVAPLFWLLDALARDQQGDTKRSGGGGAPAPVLPLSSLARLASAATPAELEEMVCSPYFRACLAQGGSGGNDGGKVGGMHDTDPDALARQILRFCGAAKNTGTGGKSEENTECTVADGAFTSNNDDVDSDIGAEVAECGASNSVAAASSNVSLFCFLTLLTAVIDAATPQGSEGAGGDDVTAAPFTGGCPDTSALLQDTARALSAELLSRLRAALWPDGADSRGGDYGSSRSGATDGAAGDGGGALARTRLREVLQGRTWCLLAATVPPLLPRAPHLLLPVAVAMLGDVAAGAAGPLLASSSCEDDAAAISTVSAVRLADGLAGLAATVLELAPPTASAGAAGTTRDGGDACASLVSEHARHGLLDALLALPAQGAAHGTPGRHALVRAVLGVAVPPAHAAALVSCFGSPSVSSSAVTITATSCLDLLVHCSTTPTDRNGQMDGSGSGDCRDGGAAPALLCGLALLGCPPPVSAADVRLLLLQLTEAAQERRCRGLPDSDRARGWQTAATRSASGSANGGAAAAGDAFYALPSSSSEASSHAAVCDTVLHTLLLLLAHSAWFGPPPLADIHDGDNEGEGDTAGGDGSSSNRCYHHPSLPHAAGAGATCSATASALLPPPLALRHVVLCQDSSVGRRYRHLTEAVAHVACRHEATFAEVVGGMLLLLLPAEGARVADASLTRSSVAAWVLACLPAYHLCFQSLSCRPPGSFGGEGEERDVGSAYMDSGPAEALSARPLFSDRQWQYWLPLLLWGADDKKDGNTATTARDMFFDYWFRLELFLLPPSPSSSGSSSSSSSSAAALVCAAVAATQTSAVCEWLSCYGRERDRCLDTTPIVSQHASSLVLSLRPHHPFVRRDTQGGTADVEEGHYGWEKGEREGATAGTTTTAAAVAADAASDSASAAAVTVTAAAARLLLHLLVRCAASCVAADALVLRWCVRELPGLAHLPRRRHRPDSTSECFSPLTLTSHPPVAALCGVLQLLHVVLARPRGVELGGRFRPALLPLLRAVRSGSDGDGDGWDGAALPTGLPHSSPSTGLAASGWLAEWWCGVLEAQLRLGKSRARCCTRHAAAADVAGAAAPDPPTLFSLPDWPALLQLTTASAACRTAAAATVTAAGVDDTEKERHENQMRQQRRALVVQAADSLSFLPQCRGCCDADASMRKLTTTSTSDETSSDAAETAAVRTLVAWCAEGLQAVGSRGGGGDSDSGAPDKQKSSKSEQRQQWGGSLRGGRDDDGDNTGADTSAGYNDSVSSCGRLLVSVMARRPRLLLHSPEAVGLHALLASGVLPLLPSVWCAAALLRLLTWGTSTVTNGSDGAGVPGTGLLLARGLANVVGRLRRWLASGAAAGGASSRTSEGSLLAAVAELTHAAALALRALDRASVCGGGAATSAAAVSASAESSREESDTAAAASDAAVNTAGVSITEMPPERKAWGVLDRGCLLEVLRLTDCVRGGGGGRASGGDSGDGSPFVRLSGADGVYIAF